MTASVVATTIAHEGVARSFAAGVTKLVDEAGQAGSSARCWSVGLTQFEAATLEGSVFVVRRGARVIAATTRPDLDGRARLLRPEALALRVSVDEAPKPATRTRKRTNGEA